MLRKLLGAAGLVAIVAVVPQAAGAVTPVVPVPGQVTYFDLPSSPGGGPVDGQLPPVVYDGIAAGADGNIWVAPAFGPVSAVSTSGVLKGSYPTAIASDVVAGSGGMWFVSGAGVGKIDSKGQVTTYPYPDSLPQCTQGVPCPTAPVSGASRSIGQIALGADGNVWFTGHGLGSASPAGVVRIWQGGDDPSASIACGGPIGGGGKEFVGLQPMGIATYVPTDPCPASGIGSPYSGIWASYPDGGTEAWIDNPDGLKDDTYYPSFVLRFRSGGAFRPVWPLKAEEPRTFSSHMNVGPDNRMWIADQLVRRIYRTGPAGDQYSVELPKPGPNEPTKLIQDLAWGPDKQMWFTAFGGAGLGGGEIGRITTGGKVQTFALPDINSVPGAITAGPDGNMWFIDRGLKKLGKITTGVATGAPTAPLGLSAASAGKGAMKVSWAVPTNTGGSPLKQFTVTLHRKLLNKTVPAGVCTTTWKHWAPASAPTSTCTFKGLAKGNYTYTVTVRNWTGKTATSASRSYQVKV